MKMNILYIIWLITIVSSIVVKNQVMVWSKVPQMSIRRMSAMTMLRALTAKNSWYNCTWFQSFPFSCSPKGLCDERV